MVKEAADHAEEDRKHKERAESINHAESVVYDIEKNLREHNDKLPAEGVTKMKKDIEELKTMFSNPNSEGEAIKTKGYQIQADSLKLFEVIYRNQQASSASQQQPNQQDNTNNNNNNSNEPPEASEKEKK